MTDGNGGQNSFKSACREARHTLDQQIEKIHREDQKAIKIFRVNILVVGVLLSGLSITVQNPDISAVGFVNAHSVLGLISMMLSTIIVTMAYTSSSYEMGVNTKGIGKAEEMGSGEYYENLSGNYDTWLKNNDAVHRFNSYAITWAIIFATAGVLFFTGGFTMGAIGLKGHLISYAVLAGEGVISLVIGLMVYYSDELFERLMNAENGHEST